jgi:small subunit ribosomal protein S14
MAKQSKIARNEHRKRLVEKYKEKRAELKAIIGDPKVSEESRLEAYRALRRLPRDSSPTRVRNRCNVTGRPRGYYRKFGLSRIAMRDLALRGDLPGVTKSSW